ncbi:FtsK/SpoIIIE domain-containing protein [Nonomuraea muscovyensis]
MRIMLTVLGEQGDRDIVLDGDDSTTIAEVGEALSGRSRLAEVVRLPRARAPYGMSAPRPVDARPRVPEQRNPLNGGAHNRSERGDSAQPFRREGSWGGGSRQGPGPTARAPEPVGFSGPNRREPRGDTVEPGARGPKGAPGENDPVLWRNGRALDPRALARAVLRDGDKVTLDPHLVRATIVEEPGGVAEVRVVGGPAAGAVHRLGLGVHVIGSDPGCTMAVADPMVAPEAVTMRVTSDAITVEPARAQHAEEAPRLKLKGRWAEEVAELTARVAEREAAARASESRSVPEVNGQPLAEKVDWPEHALLTCGSSVFTLTAIEPQDAHLTPRAEGGVAYNRPPRLRPSEGQRAFEKPREPRRAEGMRLQLLAALLPAVLGLTLAFVLRQWYFLLIALMTPIIMIGQWWSDRRHGKKQHKKAIKEYKEQLKAYEEAVERARAQDELVRRSEAPDPAQVLLTATGPRRRLWERRIHDPDALRLRVGLADLPANLELTEEQGGAIDPPICRAVPVALAMRRLGVAGVTGPRDIATGLAGWLVGQAATLHSPRDLAIVILSAHTDGEQRWGWVRWLPHCAPRGGEDCVALVGTGPDSAARRVTELAALIDERQNTAIPEFGKVPTGWDDLGGPETPAFSTYDVRPFDVLVVLDGAQALRGLPGMPQVLRQGPRAGVYTLAIDDDQRLLPEECATVAACGSNGLVRLRGGGLDVIGPVLADLVAPSWCDRLARALSPIRDVSREDPSGNLPDSVRLLDLLGLSTPTGREIAGRWRARGSTEAVIGIGPEGRFSIDLALDGPHGLIAGTTGAGKSELLQTLISALAVVNRPDQLTFVLIDYKGGAAFKECVRLPHTVGMVSDLDGHLTQRALDSLAAEIRRRERLLLAAGAKDIDDYTALAGRVGKRYEPMPRLVLIIDEFAALVAELPDFVTGLVDIARRGRSLGIHLILATQRPAGVVTSDIQANTSLRVALRVTEPMESADVIDMPDAAHISKSTPGRCYVKSGAGAATAVQTARVGGRSPLPVTASGGVRPSFPGRQAGSAGRLGTGGLSTTGGTADPHIPAGSSGQHAPPEAPEHPTSSGVAGHHAAPGLPAQHARFGSRGQGGAGSTPGTAGNGARPGDTGNVRVIDVDWRSLGRGLPPPPQPAEESTVTDLSLLADALIEAARLTGVRQQPSPWLEPLPSHLVLRPSDDTRHDTVAAGRTTGIPEDAAWASPESWEEVEPLVFGLTDRPWTQDRQPLALNLGQGGHLLIAGAARSGRSTALRTIAGAITLQASPADVHVHAIDCGSGALLPLVAMPHCGAVVTRDQLDRVERLLSRLRGEVGRRQQLLAEAGHASLAEYRQSGHRLPWLVLMLDRWEGYVAAFEGYDYGRLTEALLQLLREGPAVGLRAVVTGDRSCLLGQVSTVFEDRLILRLADSADYGLAGLPLKELPSSMPPGRALSVGEHGIVESQIALLADDPAGPAQVAALQSMTRAVVAAGERRHAMASGTFSGIRAGTGTARGRRGASASGRLAGAEHSDPADERAATGELSLRMDGSATPAGVTPYADGSAAPAGVPPFSDGSAAPVEVPPDMDGSTAPEFSVHTDVGAAAAGSSSHPAVGAAPGELSIHADEETAPDEGDGFGSELAEAGAGGGAGGVVTALRSPVGGESGDKLEGRAARRSGGGGRGAWWWQGEPPLRVDALPMRITAGQALDLAPGFVAPSPLWALVGAGGDALAPLGIDLLAQGPGAVIAGPTRSGRSSVLLTAALSLMSSGTPVLVVAPRRSPLRALQGALAVLDGNAPGLQDLVAGLERYVVLVDDAELVSPDSPLGLALEEALRSGRDGEHGVIIAGATGDLATAYRGFVADARKSRTGLLLSVQSPADGDLFNIRLPRGSVGGPPGRGLLVAAGSTIPVQAALPDGPA